MLKWSVVLVGLLALSAAAAWPVGGGKVSSSCCDGARKPLGLDLSAVSAAPPSEPVDLLFLHHSIGAQLLAEPGSDDSKAGTHPNGGGLRRLLAAQSYRVHEATYGSKLGEHTDLFDWLPKFRDHMPEVLQIAEQDSVLPDGKKNRVVLWKSCFPNSYFVGAGTEPGNPSGPELTLANAKATLRALLPVFAKQPDTLFVFLTTPPPLGQTDSEPAAKWLLKKALGKATQADVIRTRGQLARAFANWAASKDGWLKDYPHQNVAVFDLYDVMTDHGESSFLRYPSGQGFDNHPNSTGNRKVAGALVPFLNRAVRRAFPTNLAVVEPAGAP